MHTQRTRTPFTRAALAAFVVPLALFVPLAGAPGEANAMTAGKAAAVVTAPADSEGTADRPIEVEPLGLDMGALASVAKPSIVRPLACGAECVSSPFGWREHPVHGGQLHHDGTDYAAESGAPIVAIAAGEVTSVVEVDNGGYGVYVVVQHEEIGVDTLSAHAVEGSVAVAVGDRVEPGQVVAEVGSTGTSTGPHLHFEIREEGSLVDPESWLVGRGVA